MLTTAANVLRQIVTRAGVVGAVTARGPEQEQQGRVSKIDVCLVTAITSTYRKGKTRDLSPPWFWNKAETYTSFSASETLSFKRLIIS